MSLLKSFEEMNAEQQLAYKMGLEAARLEGREVWYCEPHYRTGDEDTCQSTIPLHNNCRMVRMILIDGSES